MPRKRRNNKKKPQPQRQPRRKNRQQMNRRTTKSKSGIASYLGSLAGGALAGNAGATLGRAAGSVFSKITGLGDYDIKTNALTGGITSARFESEDVVITHREFLGMVISSPTPGAFDSKVFAINPGIAATFPWLRTLAQAFEEWEPEGIVFEYIPASGSAVGSTNTALGTVVIASQYDVLQQPFQSRVEMEQHEFAVSSVPFQGMVHPIECAPNQTVLPSLYVRTDSTSLEDAADLRFHDHANVTVATVGLQAAEVTLGELWVSYKIKFRKPRLPKNVSIVYKAQGIAFGPGRPFDDLPHDPGSGPLIPSWSSAAVEIFDSTTSRSGEIAFAVPGFYVVKWYGTIDAAGTWTAGYPNVGLGSASVPARSTLYDYFFPEGTSDVVGEQWSSNVDSRYCSRVIEIKTPGEHVNIGIAFSGSAHGAAWQITVYQVPPSYAETGYMATEPMRAILARSKARRPKPVSDRKTRSPEPARSVASLDCTRPTDPYFEESRGLRDGVMVPRR